MASPDATVWLSNPTWPNHPSIIKYLGMKMAEYRYFDNATRGVDFDGLMADLGALKAGDVVLLHGCCHNPTGANLTTDQMAQVIALMQDRGAVPFVDIAYQGFGDRAGGGCADHPPDRSRFRQLPDCRQLFKKTLASTANAPAR